MVERRYREEDPNITPESRFEQQPRRQAETSLRQCILGAAGIPPLPEIRIKQDLLKMVFFGLKVAGVRSQGW